MAANGLETIRLTMSQALVKYLQVSVFRARWSTTTTY